MLVSPIERVGIFIDGSNFNRTCLALGIDVDFKRLLQLFRGAGRLVCANYYACPLDAHDLSSARPLLDWLAYNGYSVTTKAPMPHSSEGHRLGIEVDLAVDVMRLSASLDHVVLFSGSSELERLVRVLKESGKRATVVSSLKTQPVLVADGLRRAADQFVDLVDLKHDICRGPRDRQALRKS
jgi:uncharacterized LabA/DUF88 family protein